MIVDLKCKIENVVEGDENGRGIFRSPIPGTAWMNLKVQETSRQESQCHNLESNQCLQKYKTIDTNFL
jgi:hypothetical protein